MIDTARTRTAVLISGRGSNLAALLAAAAAPSYPAEMVLVVSDNPDAAGLAHAQTAHVPSMVVDHRPFATKAAFEAALDAALQDAGIEMIALAGYMRLLSPRFVDAWAGRVLNIHPSLLPLFPGLDPHGQALRAGVRVSGATVHYVAADADAGPIIAQVAVPVLPGDTTATLAARVLMAEHRLYPTALALVANGRAPVIDGRVAIDPEAFAADATLFAPAV